jgi:hypothetical protein
MAVVHSSDETLYWAGTQLIGVQFLATIRQGNMLVWRDLDYSGSENGPWTTWDTRKPISHWSYQADHLFNRVSGQGVFCNSAGTGASGCTVTYNSGTDTYSITYGSGNWVDKQSLIVCLPSAGTTSSLFSLNGNTGVAYLNNGGSSATPSNCSTTNNNEVALVYDATLNSLLFFGRNSIYSGVPPEVFVELNSEAGTQPWFTEPYLSADPITDWQIQLAKYIQTNYSNIKTWWETPNELFNCVIAGVPFYASVKSTAYHALDAAWTIAGNYCGPSGNTYQWGGKAASLLGQALAAVFNVGNLGTTYEVTGNVQTNTSSSGANSQLSMITSTAYVGQNPSNIPTQSGCAGATAVQTSCPSPFTQNAAFNYLSRLAVVNYWNTQSWGQLAELPLAYSYFNGNSTQQAAAMASWWSPDPFTVYLCCGGKTMQVTYQNWWNGVQTCNGTSGSPCVGSKLQSLDFYEGTYLATPTNVDATATVTSATNANPAVLTTAGCSAGMPVAISAASGGTWATANGSYTVQSATSNTCTINLDSTGLGTLSSLTLTWTGSNNYSSYFRRQTYLDPNLTTLTTELYGIATAIPGVNPSQFTVAGTITNGTTFRPGNGYPWVAWADDIYGFFNLATSTSSTTSGTSLTLGGTVKGIFTTGLTVLGKGIAGPGTGVSQTTVTGCTLGGSNSPPCGSTAGDILTLSQAVAQAQASGVTVNAYQAPALAANGVNTTSPVKAWPAICQWNYHAAYC